MNFLHSQLATVLSNSGISQSDQKWVWMVMMKLEERYLVHVLSYLQTLKQKDFASFVHLVRENAENAASGERSINFMQKEMVQLIQSV